VYRVNKSLRAGAKYLRGTFNDWNVVESEDGVRVIGIGIDRYRISHPIKVVHPSMQWVHDGNRIYVLEDFYGSPKGLIDIWEEDRRHRGRPWVPLEHVEHKDRHDAMKYLCRRVAETGGEVRNTPYVRYSDYA